MKRCLMLVALALPLMTSQSAAIRIPVPIDTHNGWGPAILTMIIVGVVFFVINAVIGSVRDAARRGKDK